MNRRVFLHFMALYLGFFLVTFAMSVPLYWISMRDNQDAIVKERSRLVVQGNRELSVHMDAGIQIARNLALQPEMVRLSLVDDNSEKLPLLMYNARKAIRSQIWINPIIHDIIITFPGNGVVVTQSAIYDDAGRFYDQFFSYAGMDFEAWRQKLGSRSPGWTGDAVSNGIHTAPTITYNFYSSNLLQENITVSLVIDLRQVQDYLIPGEPEAAGWLEVVDPVLGTVLTLGDPSAPGYIPLKTADTGGRFAVSAGVPGELVERSVRSQRNLLLVYAGVAVAAAAGISLAMAFYQTKPFSKLYEAVQSHSGRADELKASYKGMLQGLEDIIGNQKDLQRRYEEINVSHRNMLLDMVLHGAPLDSETAKLGRMGAFAEDYIVGIAVADNRDIRGDAILATLEEEFRGSGIYLQAIQEKTLLILPRNPLSGDRELESLEAASEKAARQRGHQIYFGLSTIKSGLSQAAKGFSEANTALRYAVRERKLFAVYTVRMTSVHPEIDQARLWEIIYQGADGQIQDWFRDLREHNEYNTDLLTAAMQYYTIVSVLQRMGLRLVSQDFLRIPPYCQSLPLAENFRALEEIALLLQREIGIQQGDGKGRTVDRALAYIQAHYREPDLSLASLADELELSERHISALIKERTGISYRELVTKLRIEAARRLLDDTDRPVGDIAAYCGYENDNTFYKAFRKWTGLSPSVYRRAGRKA